MQIDINRLRETPVNHDPFDYMVVPGFIREESLESLHKDYAAEVPPDAGTLLAFRCTPEAWHGHKPFEGRRRAIQLNWVVDASYLKREQRRHRLSAFLKKFRAA